ncbi:transporter substrate-binding domain-containing protein [Paenibacillus sp. LHD-117]|uniref:transporter substrate-binding domain-containing protein n=1 Tax=Paenibacillus sp. LHD-117 TaxID=3071412 RepID=UPI0027DEAC66|nr:transporter substrate-binding domain-containing protein [Paenibacillus sp. LHD-117]MDQ6419701.1 transporter substrate-binding domain-containing protein [Paenibacillus sp. LHD-117]
MKKMVTALAVILLTASLSACGADPKNENGGAAAGDDTPKKKIVLGTSADYAPYEFHKTIDGKDQIVGFDIEIAKEIAKDMNAELEIQDMDFDGLLLALNADKVDFVISGMTPTDERKKAVDFTDIYYLAGQGVLVKAGEEGNYSSLDDLKGKKIGVQKGSIQEGIAQEIEGAKLTSLAKIPELVLELNSGRVDALILEKPVAEQYDSKQEEVVMTGITIEQSEEEAGSAIAVKKGNQELLDSINTTLERLKANGDIDRFVIEANELVGE